MLHGKKRLSRKENIGWQRQQSAQTPLLLYTSVGALLCSWLHIDMNEGLENICPVIRGKQPKGHITVLCWTAKQVKQV